MNLNQIKKYVINLNRRPERLEHIKKEFEYIGWDFERFEAIDLNSYEGCLQSHISIVKKAKQEGLEEIEIGRAHV
jgi:GR25 family glycosyltransferase involved in LPS biosynthesis